MTAPRLTALRLAILLIIASTAASPVLATSAPEAAPEGQTAIADTLAAPAEASATLPAPADAPADAPQAQAVPAAPRPEPVVPDTDLAPTADPAAATPHAPPGLALPAATEPAVPVLAESNTLPSRGAGAASDDSFIVAEIKSRLKGDPRMESTDIQVDSVNGTVILTGSTSSDEARQAAEEIALQVKGVSRVDNRLSSPSSTNTIKERSEETLQRTGRIASDSWITTKIRSSLLADPITKSMNIGVKTVEGVVSLSGQVETKAEYDRALQLAKGIKGVKRVNTAELKIGQAE